MLSVDAIVVLGCRIRPSGRPAPRRRRRVARPRRRLPPRGRSLGRDQRGAALGGAIEARVLRRSWSPPGSPRAPSSRSSARSRPTRTPIFFGRDAAPTGRPAGAHRDLPLAHGAGLADFRAAGSTPLPVPTRDGGSAPRRARAGNPRGADGRRLPRAARRAARSRRARGLASEPGR